MIKGDKVTLRKIVKEDASYLFKAFYGRRDFSNVEKLINSWIEEYQKPVIERFAVILNKNNSFIGFIEINHFHIDNPVINFRYIVHDVVLSEIKEAINLFSEHLFNIGYQYIFYMADDDSTLIRAITDLDFAFFESDLYKYYRRRNHHYKSLMNLIKITPMNVEFATKMQHDIFPKYSAYNNYLASFKEESSNIYWLLEVNGEYIGISGLYSYKAYPQDAWLAWFGFKEPYRNKGYGKQALKLFEIEAKKRGFLYSRLFTDRYNNELAKHFYQNNGYQEEYYSLESDPASLIYPLSIFSKPLLDRIELIKWNNRDIHFTKQVNKQQ